MLLTAEQLQQIAPGKAAQAYLDAFNAVLPTYQINTPARLAAFLAQVAHESGGFRYVCELGGEKYLNDRYDTRADLGNTPAKDGDGARFCGRGLIQVTGRSNYAQCGKALGLDLLAHPELLELPANAVASACWYWQRRGLNAYADKGDFVTLTKRINGGLNGYADRLNYWERAKKALAPATVGA